MRELTDRHAECGVASAPKELMLLQGERHNMDKPSKFTTR